jgi:hypothetical protein
MNRIVSAVFWACVAGGLPLAGLVAFAEVGPEVHEKCLRAADYEGCVKAQLGGISTGNTVSEFCDRDGMCIAGKGDDRLGLPKVTGWQYFVDRDGDVWYYESRGKERMVNGLLKSLYHVIPHKGEKRYIGRRVVLHWYDPGEAATPGRTISFGSTETTCNSYGYYSSTTTRCSTTPPIRTYVRGTAGRPASARRSSRVEVVDCRENTYAVYDDGVKLRGKWTKRSNSSAPSACNELENLPVLEMSL